MGAGTKASAELRPRRRKSAAFIILRLGKGSSGGLT
jgi:hypothetical protein